MLFYIVPKYFIEISSYSVTSRASRVTLLLLLRLHLTVSGTKTVDVIKSMLMNSGVVRMTTYMYS